MCACVQSGAAQLQRQRLKEGTTYATLLARCPLELPPAVKNDIENDLHRTFPEHSLFGDGGLDALRRVLQVW